MTIIKRTIEIVVIGAICIAVALTVAFRQHLDQWLASSAAEIGGRLLHTKVEVGEVVLHFSEGLAEVKGVRIRNPAGFQTPLALEAATIAVEMNLNDLQATQLNISRITIGGLQMRVEQRGLSTNLVTLLNTLDNYALTPQATDAAHPASHKRFMVETLTIAPAQVQLLTEHHGTFNLDLPSSTFQNLGTPSEGLSAEALAKTILETLFLQAKTLTKTKLTELIEAKAGANPAMGQLETLGAPLPPANAATPPTSEGLSP